jgi:hypothetical protein
MQRTQTICNIQLTLQGICEVHAQTKRARPLTSVTSDALFNTFTATLHISELSIYTTNNNEKFNLK